ncbi:MAG: hypothetical protein DWQ04_20795 [Chloroflexi bacterium]|nr:MAG: hypothetical protein DWQ04_20795 [Chloroflexota bacterium]
MNDEFFNLNFNKPDSLAGEHYRAAYQNAVVSCNSNQILHLCDIDKVAYALQSEYKETFIGDVKAVSDDKIPQLFQRSQTAWQTYPRHYREIEHLAIKLGGYIFGKYVDVAWSHLVIGVSQLQSILPQLKNCDFGVLVEIVLLLKDTLRTQEVDWLSWEDPFIYGRDPVELMKERDNSIEETHNRLRGLQPIMKILLEAIEP